MLVRTLARKPKVVLVLVAMVEPTQATQIPESRDAAVLDWCVVVDLEMTSNVTPFDPALPVHLLDGSAQVRRDRATEMAHEHDDDKRG